MADQNLAVLSDEERREKAKMDAQVLAEAAVIRSNSERFESAKILAAEMALESADKSKAFADIAVGGLQYPQMERERAEAQSIAPSSGG